MLIDEISYALAWCDVNGIKVPADLLARMESAGIKTYDYYLRTLSTAIRRLYRGEIKESAFVDVLSELIPQQFRRAWNEGMRENGLDPAKDMTPEWEQTLQDIIAQEFEYVDGFAADVAVAGEQKTDIEALINRAAQWAEQYTKLVTVAKIETAPDGQRFKWIVGDTEHCETCLALKDVVMTADDWKALRARGIYPKSFDLACRGYNCQCELLPTNEPLTEGGIPI